MKTPPRKPAKPAKKTARTPNQAFGRKEQARFRDVVERLLETPPTSKKG